MLSWPTQGLVDIRTPIKWYKQAFIICIDFRAEEWQWTTSNIQFYQQVTSILFMCSLEQRSSGRELTLPWSTTACFSFFWNVSGQLFLSSSKLTTLRHCSNSNLRCFVSGLFVHSRFLTLNRDGCSNSREASITLSTNIQNYTRHTCTTAKLILTKHMV